MKYRFIRDHRHDHSVEMMAKTLGVTRSGYYDWLTRRPSAREQADELLVQQIRDIQHKSKRRYGSPRLTQKLAKWGIQVGHNRVARLIAERDLGALRKKPFKLTTQSKAGQFVADNILDRQFRVAAPDRVWVSDITYIPTAEGWLFLAVVLDLFSRRVVGWSMGSRIDAKLVLRAFSMAVTTRRPPVQLIFHSDRGSQYASQDFRDALSRCKARQSMSRKGNCWDNACAESFFKTLKVELIGDRIYATRQQAQTQIFEYIELFYNRERLHSTLDYLSPCDYEHRWQDQNAA